MAANTKQTRIRPGDSFDVTCVIGTVSLTDDGTGDPPGIVAMRMIAEHDAEGTYRFPRADGREQVVTIEYVGEQVY